MRSFLVALLLCLIGASVAFAQDGPAGDPALGARLVEGVATKDRLWLRNQAGAVAVFDRRTGARSFLAKAGVLDLLRHDGRTVALQAVDEALKSFAVVDLETGRRLTPATAGEGGNLLRMGRDWVVAIDDAILRSDGGPWRRQAFAAPKQGFRVVTLHATDSGEIYFGFNGGEWGGGLWRLAPGSDRLVEVRRVDGPEPCKGPLASVCDPVTGVISDDSRPACVLAATGLSHMASHGRVMRVCGDTVEEVFSRRVEAEPGSFAAFAKSTWPLFGLISSPGGWTAVTGGRLFVSRHGSVSTVPMPPLEPWAGIRMAQTEGVVLVLTDVNAGMSLSGETPLMIPVTP